MKTKKILTEDISYMTVSSLPTRPTSPIALGGRGYSPTEMKAAFDKLPLFIIERLNSLLDDITGENGGSVSDAIKTGFTDTHNLASLFEDIRNGNFASYLSVLGKNLSIQIAEILKRLDALEGGN